MRVSLQFFVGIDCHLARHFSHLWMTNFEKALSAQVLVSFKKISMEPVGNEEDLNRSGSSLKNTDIISASPKCLI